MSDRTVNDVNEPLLASPRKSLRPSQENSLPYSLCHRAAKRVKLHPCRVTVFSPSVALTGFRETCTILPPMVSMISWEHLGILDITRFTNEAWFHLA